MYNHISPVPVVKQVELERWIIVYIDLAPRSKALGIGNKERFRRLRNGMIIL
jgi:hypothetical protein